MLIPHPHFFSVDNYSHSMFFIIPKPESNVITRCGITVKIFASLNVVTQVVVVGTVCPLVQRLIIVDNFSSYFGLAYICPFKPEVDCPDFSWLPWHSDIGTGNRKAFLPIIICLIISFKVEIPYTICSVSEVQIQPQSVQKLGV